MQDVDSAELVGYDNDHCLMFRDPETQEILTFSLTSEESDYSDFCDDEVSVAELAKSLPSMEEICDKLNEHSGMKPDSDYRKHFPRNCYAVACALAELIDDGDARAVYGAYWGSSVLRPGGFHRHGWVVYGDHVIDPTRWVFEGEEPYVFIGLVDQDEEYDEGMARIRMHRSPPNKHDKAGHGDQGPYCLSWREGEAEEVQKLFGDGRDVAELYTIELFWLANTPPDALKPFIVTLYTWLEANNRMALIPVDFQTLYEHWRKKGEV